MYLFDQGIIHNFINQGILICNGLKPLSNLSVIIAKTSLVGKAQINNTDFRDFKVILESSNLLEIVPVNVRWCNGNKIESNGLESLKENYRQLKIVATKNDDVDSKLFFYKLEMDTLLKINKITKNKLNDRLILRTNHLSNDFGLSWTKAFWWLFGVSLILFTAIKFCIGDRYFRIELITEDIGKFLLFINPIHQFDKVFNIDPLKTNTQGALMLDGISKIFGAYIIYQFVSSFRKYSNR